MEDSPASADARAATQAHRAAPRGGNEREHTLEEIGERFALTRERIRQIETKALRKLQRLGGGNGLRTLLGAS